MSVKGEEKGEARVKREGKVMRCIAIDVPKGIASDRTVWFPAWCIYSKRRRYTLWTGRAERANKGVVCTCFSVS